MVNHARLLSDRSCINPRSNVRDLKFSHQNDDSELQLYTRGPYT